VDGEDVLFNANQPPPVLLAMLDTPRPGERSSALEVPRRLLQPVQVPAAQDGTDVPYPYMTVEDYYYPLESWKSTRSRIRNGGSTTLTHGLGEGRDRRLVNV
jgi:hypothetical protein